MLLTTFEVRLGERTYQRNSDGCVCVTLDRTANAVRVASRRTSETRDRRPDYHAKRVGVDGHFGEEREKRERREKKPLALLPRTFHH